MCRASIGSEARRIADSEWKRKIGVASFRLVATNRLKTKC